MHDRPTPHLPTPSDLPAAAPSIAARGRGGERLIAAFEAAKGVLILVAGCGLLVFVHRDVAALAYELVGHFHLNPASRYPHIFLDLASHVSDTRLWTLAALAFAYACLRLLEAYGLWRGRRWAEWLAACSGGLYLPIEIYELFTGISWMKLATLAANVAIVAYMVRALRRGTPRPGS